MAETKKNKSTNTKSTNKTSGASKSKATTKATATKETYVAADVNPSTIITVKNGFQGVLVYVSPRTNERYVWENFGDEQDMELRELRNAKSSSKSFFDNNWFMFDDDNAWVIDYLGLNNYYRNALSLDEFDDVFTKTPEEVKTIINGLSRGQKNSLSYRARQLVMDGAIDSIKMINVLEEALGTTLVER